MAISSESLSNLTTSLGSASGINGSIIVGDTSSNIGAFLCFVMLEDTLFTSLVGNCEGWESQVLPKGMVLPGVFSEFTLSSGKVIAFRR